MSVIPVPLRDRGYDVVLERGLLGRAGEHLHALGCRQAVVLTDETVAALYLRRVMASLSAAGISARAMILPPGERNKSPETLSRVYAFLAEAGLRRDGFMLALGGGVIGDLAGFAAATWLRGVRLVQLPTTLLAQVDASVGGKTAIDLPQGKNLIGAFHQPRRVLIDPDTLATLPDAIWRDGMGEVVKTAAIGDADLFAKLEAKPDRAAIQAETAVVEACIRYKARVVARDEHDTGLRMTLNFGHTIGHAIECCQRYQGLRHGEAVAAGMAEITRHSEQRGITESGTASRLIRLLRAVGLPTEAPDIPQEELLQVIRRDKKAASDGLRVIVLKRIGQCMTLPVDESFFD